MSPGSFKSLIYKLCAHQIIYKENLALNNLPMVDMP